MTTWQKLMKREGHAPEWPYPIRYGQEQEIETDILVLGGGIAGCWAAISAARSGLRVTLVEKGDTIRSGAGGPGCDHWENPMTSPLSNMDPHERAQSIIDARHGYSCGIGREIQCRESWDTLLEMEMMGGKIRDTEDEYVGAELRDEKTKIMYSPRYQPINACIRIWGTTFKPILKKECKRLGVNIFDRVMATSLLNEGGVQGARIVGATGINNRTGEFLIFKSKATILCMAGVGSIWVFGTELAGIATFRSRANSGDGAAMAWRAGAELTCMEKSGMLRLGTGYRHKWYTGASDASYENVPLVDDNGKRLPIGSQRYNPFTGSGKPGERMSVDTIREAVMRGEYELPFYGDFPSMPKIERDATWGLMIGEESTTKIITKTYNESGFDSSQDMLQSYQLIDGGSPPQFRSADGGGDRGGPIVDWNMKTTLDGLYAAGEQTYAPGDHSYAAATGRYAGRKAVDYAKQIVEPVISREQVDKEKERVYAPIKRDEGIEWKELHAGISRTMQYFCSEYKTEKIFNMGLKSLQEIEDKYVPKLYALDPHKLMRSLEDLSILTFSQIILHASKARKASSKFLNFERIDYPEVDPPEWAKFITVRLENNKVKVGEYPLYYWGDIKENYEANNKDYTGVYQG